MRGARHEALMPRFVKASRIEASVHEVFAFHERPEALPRLTPPWEASEVIVPPTSLAVGTVVVVATRVGPFRMRMEAEHVYYERDVEFRDRLRRGPFASWLHRHRFFPDGDATILVDDITYELPLAPLSRFADALVVTPRLEKLFTYRHEETARAVGAKAPSAVDPTPYLARDPV